MNRKIITYFLLSVFLLLIFIVPQAQAQVPIGSVVASLGSTPSRTTAYAGSKDVIFANINFLATEEDIELNSLGLTVELSKSLEGVAHNFAIYEKGTLRSNITLVNFSCSVSPCANTVEVKQLLTFSNPVFLTKGVAKTLTIQGEIGLAAPLNATLRAGIYNMNYTGSVSKITGEKEFSPSLYGPQITIVQNRPPILNLIGNKTVTEGYELSFGVSGSDPDGDEVHYSAVNLPNGASFKVATAGSNYIFKWTPTLSPSQTGVYQATFEVLDNFALKSSEQVAITVLKDTAGPVITNIVSLPSHNSVAVNWSTDEAAIGNVEYGITNTYGQSTIFTSEYIKDSKITITGLLADTLYYYKIWSKDTAGNTSSSLEKIFTTLASPKNRTPSTPLIYGANQWTINDPATFSAVASDPDRDVVSETVSSQIRYFWDWEGDGIVDEISNFVNSGVESRFEHAFSKIGAYSIKVWSEDSLNASSTKASFSVVISTGNRSPSLEKIGSQATSEGQELSFSVIGNDPDGDNALYSSSILPKGASFNKAVSPAKDYLFKWTPSYEQSGNYSVTFSVEDGKGGFNSEPVNITVNNVDIEAKKDTISPTIMSFAALPTTNSALIKWSLDENAIGKVEYSIKETLGNASSFTSEYTRNGEQKITGLTPSILYFYRIVVKDVAGNENRTGIKTFVTTSLEIVALGDRRGKIDAGAPVRVKGEEKVYQLIHGKLRHVPSPAAFSTLGFKWAEIIEVETSEIASPRLKLARVAGDSKVYYITEGGLKKWIRNIDIFNSYGDKWDDIIDVPTKDLDIYPEVNLIKLVNDDKVYRLEGTIKRWIRDVKTFNKFGYDWNKVHPVNKVEFEFYKEGDPL